MPAGLKTPCRKSPTRRHWSLFRGKQSGAKEAERQTGQRQKDDKKTEKEEEKAEDAGEAVQKAAAQIKSKQKDEEKVDAPVAVTTIVHEQPSPAAIAEEAEKGYDIFIIGLEKTSKPSAEFDRGVTNLAKGFDGPLAISAVRNDLQETPEGKLSILVPVNGTEPRDVPPRSPSPSPARQRHPSPCSTLRSVPPPDAARAAGSGPAVMRKRS